MAQLSPRLRSRLAKVPDVARIAAMKAMEEGAEEIVKEMRSLVHDRTGKLSASIGWTWGEVPAGSFTISEIRSGRNKGDQYATLQLKIYAGDKEAYYARWVEFGTAPHSVARGADLSRSKRQQNPKLHPGAAAKPFFFVVWRRRKAAFRKRIRDAVRAAIRKEWANG